MPTIHAVGAPASAWLTTLVRSSGVLQAAVAATPAAMSIAIPAHSGTCASASSAKVGAAALATEPTATSAPLRADQRARRVTAERTARRDGDDGGERRREDPQLPRLCDRDVELGRDVGEDRRHHEHTRLAREEREEEHRGRRTDDGERTRRADRAVDIPFTMAAWRTRTAMGSAALHGCGRPHPSAYPGPG